MWIIHNRHMSEPTKSLSEKQTFWISIQMTEPGNDIHDLILCIQFPCKLIQLPPVCVHQKKQIAQPEKDQVARKALCEQIDSKQGHTRDHHQRIHLRRGRFPPGNLFCNDQ